MTTDVLGEAIRDYHFDRISSHIQLKINGIEDAPLHPAIFFRTKKEMPELELDALEMCRGSILDVGAAAGCHSLVLQNMGLNTLALEPSKHCVDVMKNRGIVRAHQGWIEDFRGEKFDTILLLMNGLGMAQKLHKLADFLRHLSKMLKPGGRIIGDSSDIIYMYEQEDGSLLLPANSYYGEVRFELEYKKQRTLFDWLYVDKESLSDAAVEAELIIEKIVDGPHFDYLVVLSQENAQKKDSDAE